MNCFVLSSIMPGLYVEGRIFPLLVKDIVKATYEMGGVENYKKKAPSNFFIKNTLHLNKKQVS